MASGSQASDLPTRMRRGSIASIATTVDKDQLASALDQIHTTASQSDSLTTFNDFAAPPSSSAATENRNSAGDLVQQGFSGLYSRFREAVGVGSPTKLTHDAESSSRTPANSSKRSSLTAEGRTPRSSVIHRVDTSTSISTNSSHQVPLPEVSPTTVNSPSTTVSKPGVGLIAGNKSNGSSRQSLPTKATSSVTADEPTIAPAKAKRDQSRSTVRSQDSASPTLSRKSIPIDRAELPPIASSETSAIFENHDARLPPRSRREDTPSVAGSVETATSPVKDGRPPPPSIQTHHLRTPSGSSALLSPPDDGRRNPAVIDRLRQSRSPAAFSESRGSSVDGRSVRSAEQRSHGQAPGYSEATSKMNTQLDKMRRQILTKESWMKDDTVKECFLCQTPFSAFRRKHHCRTCGCIFDNKCTTVIAGEKFGVSGSLRVCKRCLEVMNRRTDAGSASDDSGDEQSFLPRIFGSNQPAKSPNPPSPARSKAPEISTPPLENATDTRSFQTPLMAIPATRRLGNSNRGILEIEGPQLSRPGSSRSLRSMTSGRPQSSAGHGHKRHHSKHGLFGRLRPNPEQSAPFRKGIDEESAKRPKFPAFHDDNIIDPELADYMSDDSSGDEQMSLFATMSSNDIAPGSFDKDRSNFGHYITSNKRHRHRNEKSISGISHFSRGLEEMQGPSSLANHRRPTRRRNLSNVSGNLLHSNSPRPRSAIFQEGPSASSEHLFSMDHPSKSATQLARSNSTQYKKVAKDDLNASSRKHVDKLLHQLLKDAEIPNIPAWQKALIPILLRATDDIDPDVAKGEDMDARHYVKLKRIPGGRPGDTTYVSGVVFTKNLALKSMPRRIKNPRILLLSFAVEYARHNQSFTSLDPVFTGEREFLRVAVSRIINLRPTLLLVEKSVSGVALQYLTEANIAVAYNVKHTVLEAVARCAETEIIDSMDAIHVHSEFDVGVCSSFEVRTFVNNDHPGKKKSYIFLDGCRPDLGCTIALRGSNTKDLSRIKYIVEFMVYVVYNLKLESSLLRDEAVEAPEIEQSSLSSSVQGLNESVASLQPAGDSSDEKYGTLARDAVEETPGSQAISEPAAEGATHAQAAADEPDSSVSTERPQLVSLHDTHAGRSHDGHFSDDIPMPTFYSDMVAKYDTKILSASPYVKFSQPYLLDKAREQERRLLYLKKLRDHDIVEERENAEKLGPQPFQLIRPEMVDEIGQKAPRQSMEILHAAHDAEYDKALFHYQTQTKQWETYIQGNLDLFDPYSHQNIVVLYSVICTESKIPCVEPNLVAINFYDEQHVDTGMDPDCSIGQYIEDLVYTKDEHCGSTACGRRMVEHHRTYVHDQSRITVFVEEAPTPARRVRSDDGITMWTYCKVCKKDSEEVPMSSVTFKYSFGKYLELIYWGRGLRMKNQADCPHDHHRDHVRYFGLMNCRVRIHWDPIDLLEIIVPRPRITWKVANDLQLKNDIFERMGDRWHRFMGTVKARLDSIRIDSSVLPDKAESCRTDLDKLKQKQATEEPEIIARLQDIYVNTKYYEIIPFNSIVREMVVKAGEWDQAFAQFEADYLGDKDMRQLTMMQLKKMFTDNESKESLTSNDATGSSADSDGQPSQAFSELDEKGSQPTELTESSLVGSPRSTDQPAAERESIEVDKPRVPVEEAIDRVEPLDLAGSPAVPVPTHSPLSALPVGSEMTPNPLVAPKPVENPTEAHSPPSEERPTSAVEPSRQTLAEQVDKMRREQVAQDSDQLEKNVDQAISEEHKSTVANSTRRRSGLHVSPPLIRAISQPVRTLPRNQTSAGKALAGKDLKTKSPDIAENEKQSEGTIKGDKRLSDRLGLSALKNRGKATSSIPRLVKRKESKVSTLARHFEQLSREFEKERIRDRKKRAASMRQPRAMLPRTTTRAVVEVYDNVAEAFEEPNPSTEISQESEKDRSQDAHPDEAASTLDSVTDTTADRGEGDPASADGVPRSSEQDEGSLTKTSQSYSDDEGAASEAEHSVPEEFLGGIQEIAEALEPSTEIPLELPKHQKTSLMKYLTNFWAERSASGWPMLDYPVNPTDHIFTDSDIVVREDEPSSVVALALSSEDYQGKLAQILKDAQDTMQRDATTPTASDPKSGASDESTAPFDEAEIEKSLLRLTGTHLNYKFKEGQCIMSCKIFFAEQFDALRRKCGVGERTVESLSRCLKWDSRGGKTKSVFLKTLDDRFILKSLSPIETSAFLKFAPGYFNIMAEALFHELPSVIAKMFGFYQVVIKNPVTGTDVRLDLLLTENLFYDRSPNRIFDLKGSMRNRKIESTGDQNEVLLDENMVEYIYESPLFAREHAKKLLRASVWNDTLFLARQDVMDYSLMIAVDEAKKELVVGIIDCIRTYTWDKKLESWIKDRGFAGGGRNRPTVTSPKEYKSRFREAMARYILQAPNCWHLFNNIQYPHFPGPNRARFDEPETLGQ